ncbi:MAG: hypothetical protein F2817_01840 [Actinobacteria bacterium]|nr:hypothetical protein [Actinomycetota bacterium]
MSDALDSFLAPLPADRRDAVKSWLDSAVGTCSICERPLLVCDPKVTPPKSNGPVHKVCAATQD